MDRRETAVPGEESGNGRSASDSLWRAVKLIAVADVVMSLDNVIAVAAVADGNFALLVFGLGISIPADRRRRQYSHGRAQLFPFHHLGRRGPAGLDRGRRHRQRPGGDKFRGIVRPRRAGQGQARLRGRRAWWERWRFSLIGRARLRAAQLDA